MNRLLYIGCMLFMSLLNVNAHVGYHFPFDGNIAQDDIRNSHQLVGLNGNSNQLVMNNFLSVISDGWMTMTLHEGTDFIAPFGSEVLSIAQNSRITDINKDVQNDYNSTIIGDSYLLFQFDRRLSLSLLYYRYAM